MYSMPQMPAVMAGNHGLCTAERAGRLPPRGRSRGFSLIELMVALAVLAVLSAIAVPSFRNLSLSSRLTTEANEFVAAITTARMEAIKRNASAQFCSDSSSANASGSGDTLGSECAGNGGAVYAMQGSSAQLVRDAIAGLSDSVKLNGNLKAIRFSGTGLGHEVGSSAPFTGYIADICSPSLSSDGHRKVKLTAGSVVSVEKSSDACE